MRVGPHQCLAAPQPAGPRAARRSDGARLGPSSTLHPGRPDTAAARLPAWLERRRRHLGRVLLVSHARESQDGLRPRGRTRDPRGRGPHRVGAGVGPPRRRIRREAGARRLLVGDLGRAADLAVHHAGPAVADRDRSRAGRCAVGRPRHRDDGSVDRSGAAARPSVLPGDVRHRRRPGLRPHVGARRSPRLGDRRARTRARLDVARRPRAVLLVGARPRRRRPPGRANRGARGAQCPGAGRGRDRDAGEPLDAVSRRPAGLVVSEGRASPRA